MTARVRNLYGRSHFEDTDYLSYLEIKYSSPERGRSPERSDSRPVDDDNDDFDPQYVMFLNNTKQKGINSYLTTLEENGLVTFIDYEKEGSSSDEWDENGNLSSKVKNRKHDSEGSKFEEEITIDRDYEDHKRYLEKGNNSHVSTLEENGLLTFIDYDKEGTSSDEWDENSNLSSKVKNRKHDSEGSKFEEEITIDGDNGDHKRYLEKGNNSYVSTLEENGLLTFIDYEKEGSSSDESDENNNLSSKVKNRKHDSEGSKFEEEITIDGDYKRYLKIRYGSHQEGDAERGYNSDHNKHDANGNTDYDPDYVLFLKNTKEKGNNSYVTTLEENGLLTFIDYEKEGSSSDEWDENNSLSSTVKNREYDSEGSKFEEVMIDGDYKRYLEIRYGSHQEGDAERGYNPDHNKDDANGNKDYDPDYVMFLNSIKCDGVSYATAFEANGVRTFINYEKEGNCSADRNDDLTCALKKGRKGDKVEGNYWKNVKGKMSNGVKGGLGSSDVPNTKEDEMVQPFTPLPKGERAIHKNQQRRITRSNSIKIQKTSQTIPEENYVDKDYALLLQAMKLHCEGNASKTLSPNKHAVENDYDDSGDDEVVEIDYFKFSNAGRSHPFSPQVHYCEAGNAFEPVYKDEDSEFRQKVITFLKRPFDQTEYEKLLHDVKVQKPVERNLELRHGRDKYCPLDRNGKSYLDYFEDFNNKFEQASSNKYKTLNILRGFFFWLQNITQEGAFKPWNDPTCLAVIPGFG